jgi:hypothetical protein
MYLVLHNNVYIIYLFINTCTCRAALPRINVLSSHLCDSAAIIGETGIHDIVHVANKLECRIFIRLLKSLTTLRYFFELLP